MTVNNSSNPTGPSVPTGSAQSSGVNTEVTEVQTPAQAAAAPPPQDSAATAEEREAAFFTNAGFPQIPAPKDDANPEDWTFFSEVPVDEELASEIQTTFSDELDKKQREGKLSEADKNRILNMHSLGLEEQIPENLKDVYKEALDTAQQKLQRKYPQYHPPFPRDIEKNRENFSKLREAFLGQILQEKGFASQDGALSPEGLAIRHQVLSGTASGGSAGNVLEALNTALQIHLSIGSEFIIDDDAVVTYLAQVGAAFEGAVLAKAPEGQEGRFEYLFNHPDPSDPLQPAVDAARTAALKELQKQFGVPSNFVPAESAFLYDSKLNGTYYNAINQNLLRQGAIVTQGDRQAVEGYIKAMAEGRANSFSLDGYNTSLSLEQVKQLGEGVHAAAISVLQARFDIPGTWKPDPSRSLADFQGGPMFSVVNQLQNIHDAFLTRIENDPNLTPEQKITLKDFLRLISEALTDMNELMYMMQIKEAEGSRDASKVVLSLINEKRDMVKTQMKVRAEKRAEFAEQQRKADEQRRKEESKGKVMNVIIPIVTVITIIATVYFMPMAAAVMVPLMIGIFLASYGPIYGKDANGNNKPTLMDRAFQGLNKSMETGAVKAAMAKARIDALSNGKTPEQADQAAIEARNKHPDFMRNQGIFLGVVGAVTLLSVFGGSGAAGVTTLITATMIMESGAVTNLYAQAAPEPPWLSSVLTILTIIAFLAVVGGASSAKSAHSSGKAAAKGGEVAAKSAGRLARLAARIAKFSPKLAKMGTSLKHFGSAARSSRTTQILMGSLMAGAQITQTTPQIISNIQRGVYLQQLADITDRIADLIEDEATTEAELEMVQSIIDLFNKLIEQLQNSSAEYTEMISDIQNALPKNYQVSEALTTGWDALQG